MINIFCGEVCLLVLKPFNNDFHMLQERTPILNMDFLANLGCEKLQATMRLEQIIVLDHPDWCSVCDPAKIIFTSKCSYLLF
jgi:hypothetical protein